LDRADDVARAGAAIIDADARAAIAARGMFAIAVSGGRTSWIMLRALSVESGPWAGVHVFQVDERVVPGYQERHCAVCLLHFGKDLASDRMSLSTFSAA